MKNQIKVLLTAVLISGTFQMFAQETKTSTTTTTTTTTPGVAVDSGKVNKADNSVKPEADFPTAYIGFLFMPTVSSFGITEAEGSAVTVESVVGLGWGGFIGFNITDHFGIQGEIIYSPLAQKYAIDNVKSTVHLNYINIPLLARFNTGYSKPVNFNVVVGPQIGFNVGSSVDTDNDPSGTTVETKVNVKKGDLGFAYGAGLDFNLGGFTRLDVGFRGVYGLVDISDGNNTQTTSDYYVVDKTHIKTYAGYIGISFGF